MKKQITIDIDELTGLLSKLINDKFEGLKLELNTSLVEQINELSTNQVALSTKVDLLLNQKTKKIAGKNSKLATVDEEITETDKTPVIQTKEVVKEEKEKEKTPTVKKAPAKRVTAKKLSAEDNFKIEFEKNDKFRDTYYLPEWRADIDNNNEVKKKRTDATKNRVKAELVWTRYYAESTPNGTYKQQYYSEYNKDNTTEQSQQLDVEERSYN